MFVNLFIHLMTKEKKWVIFPAWIIASEMLSQSSKWLYFFHVRPLWLLHRRVCGFVEVWFTESLGSWGCESQFEGQRKWDEMSQLKEWGRKKRTNSFFLGLLFYSGPQRITYLPRHNRGEAPSQTRSEIMFKLGTLQPVKMTHKINHCTC